MLVTKLLSMRSAIAVCVFGLSANLQVSQAQPNASTPQQTVVSCKQLTLINEHVGVPYRGRVRNPDYHFNLTVPRNMTAWGGVAGEAPFHGFELFLDDAEQSCILFEIHIRIDENAVVRPTEVRSMAFGKARGWQKEAFGVSNGIQLQNTITTFSYKQKGEIDDGEVVFVAPVSHAQQFEKIHNEFLRYLNFY